jgi:hypothetical protein
MSDTNFVMPSGMVFSQPSASFATDREGVGEVPAILFRMKIDRHRGPKQRWPLPVRLLCFACFGILGWFLLIAPLFITL